jgi:hypothetical protein
MYVNYWRIQDTKVNHSLEHYSLNSRQNDLINEHSQRLSHKEVLNLKHFRFSQLESTLMYELDRKMTLLD